MTVCAARYCSTSFCEEGLEDGGAVCCEDTGSDFDLMVEAWIGKNFEARADGSAFGVVRTVYQTRDAGLNDRAGAHAAGLDGDVERCSCEAVISEGARGFAQDDDLGVRRRIAIADGAVCSARHDGAVGVAHKYGAYRHFTGSRCAARFFERDSHELNVSLCRKAFHRNARITRTPSAAS
jgi:hypothetical protein